MPSCLPLNDVACHFDKIDCGCCKRLHRHLCTIAILCMPPLLRPHRVGPWYGCMLGPIVHQAVLRAFFCNDTTHITCPECGVYQCALHASVLCPSEICVALRKWRVQFTTTRACIVLAFALGDLCAVGKPPVVDEVCPKVVIRSKEFFVPAGHFEGHLVKPSTRSSKT